MERALFISGPLPTKAYPVITNANCFFLPFPFKFILNKYMWTVLSSFNSVLSYTEQWRIQGGGGAPLFVDQTVARRAQKDFQTDFSPPPPISGSGWSFPHLIWRSGSATAEACALYVSQLDSRLSNTWINSNTRKQFFRMLNYNRSKRSPDIHRDNPGRRIGWGIGRT